MLDKNQSPAGSSKTQIAEHIRNADLLVKEGRYDDAVVQVEKALHLDPKNYFARSFMERLRFQMDKRQKLLTGQRPQKSELDEKEVAEIAGLLRTADKFIGEKNYVSALQQIVKVYTIDPKNTFARGYFDRIDALLEAEKSEALAAGKGQAVSEPLWKDGERASLAMYREMLKEMWFDGKVTEEEARQLLKTRQMFGITEQEHTQMEKQVCVDAYVEALRIAWHSGKLSQNESEVLKLLREKYNISIDEHMNAEARILLAKNTPAEKFSVLLVDDEPTFRSTLAAQLKRRGYDVITTETAEEALRLLETMIPSIIISDLMLGEKIMTGLEFYQKVRESPKFNNVPYLLISATNDEYVVRAGMRLGLDNFIGKPFDFENLLAIIEGKLK